MIKTICAALYCLFIMIFTLIPGIILYLIQQIPLKPFRTAAVKGFNIIILIWTRGVFFISGITVTVRGRENLTGNPGLCLVSNHDGIFDILVIMAYSPRPVSFIAREELSLIPFLNIWILLLGGSFIDRNNPRKALKTMRTAVKHIQNGAFMLIFPEGTRSRGRGLLPFKDGAFNLAVKSRARVIPVAIKGTGEVFEKSMRVRKHHLFISFGKALETGAVRNIRETLPAQVRNIIEEMLKSTPEERPGTPAE